MFVAYDKVPFAQYSLYEQYALLVPGEDTKSLAYQIRFHSKDDADMVAVNGDLLTLVTRSAIPIEYTLFAIRGVDGVLCDVYFLDEDDILIACATGVAVEDVLMVSTRMVEDKVAQ